MTAFVSVGSLVVAVNKVTDILYKLINPTKKDTHSNEKKDHSPVKVVSNRIEKYHSPVKVVSNRSEKYHTPINVNVVSDSDSIERYYTPVKEYISKPKRSINIPNAKIKVSKEKKGYKKRVTKKKIIKEEKQKLTMLETEKNIYNIYINEN